MSRKPLLQTNFAMDPHHPHHPIDDAKPPVPSGPISCLAPTLLYIMCAEAQRQLHYIASSFKCCTYRKTTVPYCQRLLNKHNMVEEESRRMKRKESRRMRREEDTARGREGGQFLKILGQNGITVPSGKCHTASQTCDCHFQTVSLALTHPSRSSYHNNGNKKYKKQKYSKKFIDINIECIVCLVSLNKTFGCSLPPMCLCQLQSPQSGENF